MVRRGKCIGPSLPRRVAVSRIAHLPSARKSVPPAGDFALAFGFVGLIFLVFPASLGLSTGSKITLPCSGLEQTPRAHPDWIESGCGLDFLILRMSC